MRTIPVFANETERLSDRPQPNLERSDSAVQVFGVAGRAHAEPLSRLGEGCVVADSVALVRLRGEPEDEIAVPIFDELDGPASRHASNKYHAACAAVQPIAVNPFAWPTCRSGDCKP